MRNASTHLRAFDLFCGAGGSSCGASLAGAQVAGGIDSWGTAISTFRLNFPDAATWAKPIEQISVSSVIKKVGYIDLLIASPECTNHTFAKGNRRNGVEQERSRRTAFQVIRFARVMQPRWIVVENVVSMRRWDKYMAWWSGLETLGYHLQEITLDAQLLGVAQSRRRLFVLADRQKPPDVRVPSVAEVTPVTGILNTGVEANRFNYQMSPLFSNGRAADTLTRAKRAMSKLGPNQGFLLVYYGTDAAGGWQPLDRPLRTITTLDRFALVQPSRSGHMMRMLQPPELAAAMGFPADYRWPDLTRRDRIKLIGNAVCPPVMKHVVSALVGHRS